MSTKSSQKLYCYVDETGQDTRSEHFFVSLIITGKDREPLRELLNQIENRSWKGHKKWTKSTIKQRIAYLEEIVQHPAFKGLLHFQQFPRPVNYLAATIEAISRGIARFTNEPYKANVLIDALNKHDRRIVATRLRKRHVRIERVRGLTDEADEFIRLADAIAGLVRAAFEGKSYATPLYDSAIKNGVLISL